MGVIAIGALLLTGWGQHWWPATWRPWTTLATWIRGVTASPTTTSLQTQRDSLFSQVAALTQRVSALQENLRASRNVTDLQSIRHDQRTRILPTTIVTVNTDPGLQTMVVHAGQSEGLRVGYGVVAPNGIVIGKIVRVHAHLADVLLLTDSQSVMAAAVANEARTPGVVRGERGLSVQMEDIPRGDTVRVNDVIVTSGTEPGIPADFVIGLVKTVTARAGDIFQTAELASPTDVARLDVVGIILPT